MRELLFHITAADCRMDTFRAGGKGGQNQNKRDTGVRFVHPPSGATGESREERSQLQNKRKAWRKMAESAAFQSWARRQAAGIDAEVDRAMAPANLKIEYGAAAIS